MANSAVGMSREGRKRPATRINWSSVKEKDIVFQRRSWGYHCFKRLSNYVIETHFLMTVFLLRVYNQTVSVQMNVEW